MKKWWVMIMIAGILAGCNESGSAEQKLDSLTKKVDSVSQKTWDSGKKEIKGLKEKIQDELGRKDTLKN